MTPAAWWRQLVDDAGVLGRIRRQWPWVVMVVIMAVGLLLIVLRYWRRGSVIIGLALVFGGLARCLLKEPGILTIRQRTWVDAVIYFGLGLGAVIIALVVPPSA